MLEVIHRPAGAAWAFNCPAAPIVQGGGRSLEDSHSAAEHAVRFHLSRIKGYPLAMSEACFEMRHVDR